MYIVTLMFGASKWVPSSVDWLFLTGFLYWRWGAIYAIKLLCVDKYPTNKIKPCRVIPITFVTLTRSVIYAVPLPVSMRWTEQTLPTHTYHDLSAWQQWTVRAELERPLGLSNQGTHPAASECNISRLKIRMSPVTSESIHHMYVTAVFTHGVS